MRRARVLFAACAGLSLLWLSAPGAHALAAAHVDVKTGGPAAGVLSPTWVWVHLTPEVYGGTPPTGNAIVKDNGVTIGTATPGTCFGQPCVTFPYTFEGGDHSLVAYYEGDSNYAPAKSEPFNMPLGRLPPLETFQSNIPKEVSNTITVMSTDDLITLTCTVAGVAGYWYPWTPTKQPTGSFTVIDVPDGDRVLGIVPLTNGTATFSTRMRADRTPYGTHTVVMNYSGDTNYLADTYPRCVWTFRTVQAASGSNVTTSGSTGTTTSGSTRTTTPAARQSSTTVVRAAGGAHISDLQPGDTTNPHESAISPSQDSAPSDPGPVSGVATLTIREQASDSSSSPLALDALGGASLTGAGAAVAWYVRKRAAALLLP